MSARAAVAARPVAVCPSSGRTEGGAVVEVSRGPDGAGTGWDGVAVASRRAVTALVRTARTSGADGLVGVRLTTGPDGVRASGLLVRRGLVRAAADLDDRDDGDDPFATHLPFAAAALAVEAGLRPRSVVVTAVRAARHDRTGDAGDADEAGDLQDPPDVAALVAVAHDAASGAWRTARRRRGPATVLLDDLATTWRAAACPAEAGARDVEVVLTSLGTVLAGSATKAAARAVTDRLDRVVVAVGAG